MNVLVISCSLHHDSRSARLAALAVDALRSLEVDPQQIDLRDHDLPLCDGLHTPTHPDAVMLAGKIRQSHAVILAVPVYNYYANAAAKNLIELTGKAWQDKVVAFLCAAGGHGSYMSVMALANSLMLDFHCLIVPRFVYATGHAFDEDLRPNEKILTRIGALCEQLTHLAHAAQTDPLSTPDP